MKFKRISFLLLLINFSQIISKSEQDIIRAVMSADLEEIKDCIEMQVSVDTRDANNNTLIMIAVKNLDTQPKIQKQIINFLLDKGAKLDTFNNQEETALTLAIFWGLEELVDLFLSKGAHKNLDSKILSNAYNKGKAANGPGFPEKYYNIREMLKEAIRKENEIAKKEVDPKKNDGPAKDLSSTDNNSGYKPWF